MPSSFTAFDPTLPLGTNPGTNVPTDFRNNGNALRYAIASGCIPGAIAIVVGAGSAAQPAQYTWTRTDGAITHVVRATNTWGTTGGAAGNLSSQLFEVSQDAGSTWATVGTKAFTYDASGNLTAVSGLSSMLDFLWALVGSVKAWIATVAAHIAATGAAVHGLGTMATQAANAVALTGGTASLTYYRSKKIAIGSINASTSLNWASGEIFTVTVTGASAVFTHAGLPSGVIGWVLVEVTNGGLATNLFSGCQSAGGVQPVLKTSGKDVVSLYCHDGATVVVGGILADVKAF